LALRTSLLAKTFNGWFLGGGYEYGISFLPGLFWKTEYRYSSFHAADITEVFDATGLPTGDGVHASKHEQTVRTELVWRFNWSGGSFFH
jgi:outer membrane immunogenic protein